MRTRAISFLTLRWGPTRSARDYFPLGVVRAVRVLTNLKLTYACGMTA